MLSKELAKAFAAVLILPSLGQPEVPQTQRATFEVASVKLIETPSYRSFIKPSGRGLVAQASLADFIQYAYGLQGYQLRGGPKWIASQGYEISAKTGAESADEEIQVMLRSLLSERFRLVVHQESRILPSLVLTAGRAKPKMAPSDHPGEPEISGQFSVGDITAQKISMDYFAKFLSLMLQCPVLDKTNLQGRYDFRLRWAPDDRPTAENPNAQVAAAEASSSLITAVRQQLGMRLQKAKSRIDVVVVDAVERIPVAN